MSTRPKALTLKLRTVTPGVFKRRLHGMGGDAGLWVWHPFGVGGESTVFHQVEDRDMRCAIAFQPEQWAVVKVGDSMHEVTELLQSHFSTWRCHLLARRGGRESDCQFLRIVWTALDLPMARVAPELTGEVHG